MPHPLIYVDQTIAENDLVRDFHARHQLPFEIIDNPKNLFERISQDPDPVSKGKKTLFLTKNRGAFIKACPGTRHYTCCGYQILHVGTFCSMDCSYCILQSYFHPPLMQFFVNHDDLLNELEQSFTKTDIRRLGTGEFTDSLIWERWFPLSELLVPRFARQARAVLELKTKTIAIEPLKGLAHNRKTIMAWSLNAPTIVRTEEKGTASLAARFKAAKQCESWGYPLAFHFDPIFLFDNCAAEYRQVIRDLFSWVSPENVVWISLGTFRFMPALKPIIQRRFPNSRRIYGEFVPGLDAKMRYFKPLRIEIYRQIAGWIREVAPQVLVYLCMEDDEVWEKGMGFKPCEQGGLSSMLDQSAERHCGLGN